MADKKLSELTAASTVTDTDYVPIVTGGVNKTALYSVIKTWIKSWIVKTDVGLSNVDNTSDATKNAATATLTNKTITSPAITTPTGIVKGDVGLGNVDNTSDATKNAATAKLTNKTTQPTAQTYSPTAAGTATLDLDTGNHHDITLPAGNITVALSNGANNEWFTVSLTQDSVGSRTVTWFTTIKWAGGTPPTLTTTANKRDILLFKRTGSATYDGFVVGQNI